jgi:hypothetical protein
MFGRLTALGGQLAPPLSSEQWSSEPLSSEAET